MKTWLLRLWDILRTNFWFIPTVMVVLAIALSFVMIQLDKIAPYRNRVAALGWTFTRGPEGSRAVLSVVAGSMMTISSISFSITIVVLQLASSQFGPRILRNFVRDRANQAVLGTFIATFTYCLLVLRTVNNGGDDSAAFVPTISVTVGLLLALSSLGVLIYFINHVATAIQADTVIGGVSRDLHAAIDFLYPQQLGQEAPEGQKHDETSPVLPENFERECRCIQAPSSDYLQALDNEGLMSLAVEHDLLIRLDYRPGKFVVQEQPMALAWPRERVSDEVADGIRACFYFGEHRTMFQDAEFAVDQLVEIAVRAMSPGVNDPFTAMTCIDRLASGFCHLVERELPSKRRYDDKGRLRIVAAETTFAGMAEAAFNQIRQVSRSNPAVSIRLLEALTTIATHSRNTDARLIILEHATRVFRGASDGIVDECDRQEAIERFERLSRLIAPVEDAPATVCQEPS